jgi:non-lysosomal glucosylceramidase
MAPRPRLNSSWPVLKTYSDRELTTISLPLGGIGTGTIGLGGRGQLRDFEIVNRAAKGHDGRTLFALHVAPEGGPPITKVLEGALLPPFAGAMGATAPWHGCPRFRHCEFHAAYPMAQVTLHDPEVPVQVRLEAFNPFVPGDAAASGWPLAIMRFVVRNAGKVKAVVGLSGSLVNFIGHDGAEGKGEKNLIEFRQGPEASGLYYRSEDVSASAPAGGTMALVALGPGELTYKRNWDPGRWNVGILGFWDDFSADGRLDDTGTAPLANPVGSLARTGTLGPGEEQEFTFILAWHFPHRQKWHPSKAAMPAPAAPNPATGCCEPGQSCGDPNRVGNYYTTLWRDAWAVIEAAVPELQALENRTIAFVQAFAGSDLPEPVKEAALFNLSTLRSETCFRTEDGYFHVWEGCGDKWGCCYGSCTHVWNYEQATAFLFGDLSRKLRELEFLYATDDQGLMSFRIGLPLSSAKEFGLAAADGQMGCLMKLYRDWQLHGDDAWLRQLWPKAKAALAFCWIPGGWDADQDGAMEGCQHNTLDVEYYGPNGLMQGWYLGALRAAEEMALYLGDKDFAKQCRKLFTKGKAWTEKKLFNGEYFVHLVQTPKDWDAIAKGLRHNMGAASLKDPDFQLGPGCLVDQLAGQFLAHVCGLGYLLDQDQVRRTLKSIMKYNWRDDFYNHFNNMRTYALNDEQGLVMTSYPRGNRPHKPQPYFNELMTGFEYTAAVHMLYEGQRTDGLKAIAAVRARYDGDRRNPYDEAECGHHYGRAMAVWGAVLALTGFHYSAVTGALTFAGRAGQHFWSTGNAWGTVRITKDERGLKVVVLVQEGELRIASLNLSGWGALEPRTPKVLTGFMSRTFFVPHAQS